MASSLSEQQRLKIEENRQRALALRAARQQQTQPMTAADCERKSMLGNNCQSAMNTMSARSSALSWSSVSPPPSSTHVRKFSSTNFPSTTAKYCSTQMSCASSQFKPRQPTTLADSSNRVTNNCSRMTSSWNASVHVKCCLVSKMKFAADCRYSAPLVEIFKSIPSKQYGDYLFRVYSLLNSNYCQLH